MKRIYSIVIAAMIITMTASLSFAGVAGSAHDFSAQTWSGGQICVVCHAPHDGTGAANGLLWNRALSTKTYQMYASTGLPNFIDGAIDPQPTGISKLCLGCHDGSIAVDAFGGAAGGAFFTPTNRQIGADGNLTNDHPISIVYNNVADAGLNPTSYLLGANTIAAVLDGGKVQCSTCHDVHNEEALGTPLLRQTLAGSQLCSSCHTK